MKSLPSESRDFVYGGLIYRYELVHQDRKTLNLTVMPDLSIFVKTPKHASDHRIEMFLRKKWFWLEKQLMFFGKYQRKVYKREFVSGEGVRYLGKQYQLVVKQGEQDKVALQNGLLVVTTGKKSSTPKYRENLVNQWYKDKIMQVFSDRYKVIMSQFNYKVAPKFSVRDMKRRWGSCLDNGKIILNPKLIHVSKDCIDYVITHELCHIKYKNHDKKFFNFLSEKYPGWQKVKENLEITGSLIQG